MGFENVPLRHENQEHLYSERLKNADCFLRDFMGVKEDERVLFLNHKDPGSTDSRLIGILKDALDRRGITYHEFVADLETETQEVVALLDAYPVVWSSCNWDETKIDFYEVVEALEDKQGRMEDAAGLTADALNNDGMLSESLEILHDRLKRMGERLRESVGFHVRSTYGTDILIALRPHHDRRWAWVTGEVDPGEWDNPGAEIFTTPDETGVNGVLMLPVLQDEITREQGVDDFVQVIFHDGQIIKIDGGKSAEKLRAYLEKMSIHEENPKSVAQCSEIAFGGSVYARSKVSDEYAAYTHPGISVLEAEKRLGTMHVAIGSAKHGIEGSEGFTESNVHVDFVIPRSGLTVTAFYSQNDLGKRRNGQRLINDGSWNFF